MASQSPHLFSQGGDLTGLSEPLNINGSDADQRGVSQCPAEEEALLSRAETICNQNRQTRYVSEKKIKQCEKRRIQIASKKRMIEEEIKVWEEKHKIQSQQVVHFQLNIENMSEIYQSELKERQTVIEKMNNTQKIVDFFKQQYTEIPKIATDIEQSYADVSEGLENVCKELQEKKKKEFMLSYSTNMSENIQKVEEVKRLLIKQRKDGFTKMHILEAKYNENVTQLATQKERSSFLTNKISELNSLFSEIQDKNRLMKKDVIKLHTTIKDITTTSAQEVQQLNLSIHDQQNNNSYLEAKCEEIERAFSVAPHKEKESDSLFQQMTTAVEETKKRLEENKTQIEELTAKQHALASEINLLHLQISEHDNVEGAHQMLIEDISILENNIVAKKELLLEKENLVKGIIDETEQLKTASSESENGLRQLDEQLLDATSYLQDLESKLNELISHNKSERDAMEFKTRTLVKENKHITDGLNTLTSDLEAARNMNSALLEEEGNICKLIDENTKCKVDANKQLIIEESKWADEYKAVNERIEAKQNELNETEKFNNEAKQYQEELANLKTRIESINKDLEYKKEFFNKEKEIYENNMNSKIMAIARESESYVSTVDTNIKKEEEAGEKFKEEVTTTNTNRNKHKEELKKLYQYCEKLKKMEVLKREKISKLDAKLKWIDREVKVTEQDIRKAFFEDDKAKCPSLTSSLPPPSNDSSTVIGKVDTVKKRHVSFRDT